MFDDYEGRLKTQGFELIIGIDEAGRGPLAGPVVAAAVHINKHSFSQKIADSKKISEKKRIKAFHEIFENAYVGIGIISESVIDENNILRATYFAMNNAVVHLIRRLPGGIMNEMEFRKSVCLLIDGNSFHSLVPYTYKTVINGDARVLSIACASIIAKVTRDRILGHYDKIYPQYGFSGHKGYGTAKHKLAIKEHGLTDIHRKSFAPCQL